MGWALLLELDLAQSSAPGRLETRPPLGESAYFLLQMKQTKAVGRASMPAILLDLLGLKGKKASPQRAGQLYRS